MRAFLLPALIVVSLVAHVGASMFLDAHLTRPHRPPAIVEIATPKRPSPPPPATPAATPPAARTAPHVPRALAPRTHAVKPPPPSPAPAPPAPADFTGVTLTNESGGGWVTATGDGGALAGPIATPTERPQAPPGAPRGPPVVALGDLSRAPKAPDLDDALRANYPADARGSGLAGKAVVRARIAADGRARVLAVVHESAAGFGEACRRTVAGSRWDPPLGRDGTPVVTELSYTCRFEVGR